MTKPEKIFLDNIDYYHWFYEDQTRMKHEVLKEYLQSWITILGSNSQVAYFDCFGGCGAYTDGSASYLGSPFLIADIASELKERNNRHTGVFVCEKEKENYDNLNLINSHRSSQLVKPMICNCTFEEMIKDDSVKSIYQRFPSFFFIDPFGFSIVLDDYLPIMQYTKNELLINFMYDHISRFLSLENMEDKYDSFFGCEDWRNARRLNGYERENYLVDLYIRQLKLTSKYVFAFRMSYPERDRTYYYLFHATNSLKGVTIMKSAFASLNEGKVEYLGKNKDKRTLFEIVKDLPETRLTELQQILIDNYAGKEITFDQIVEDLIEPTYYIEKEIRAALKELKRDGTISIKLVESKRNGIKGKDIVIFK